MAQQNPIDKAEGLSSTGSTHAPLSTSSTYKTPSQTTGPTHGASTSTLPSSSSTDPRSTGQKVRDLFHDDPTSTNTGGSGTGTEGKGIGGVFAAVHGAGEKIRGEFNAGVDRAFDEGEGEKKNAGVAAAGDREMERGRFDGSTKARELGDGGRRV